MKHHKSNKLYIRLFYYLDNCPNNEGAFIIFKSVLIKPTSVSDKTIIIIIIVIQDDKDKSTTSEEVIDSISLTDGNSFIINK